MSLSSKRRDVSETPVTAGLQDEEINTLSEKSIAAKAGAYCPYSLFRVGCAILTNDGTVITGANIENAAYPVGVCAERNAMGAAAFQGFRMGSIKAVAVATDITPPTSPCGMCRQFLREFCDPATPILMFDKDSEMQAMALDTLLPFSFGPDALPPREKLAALKKNIQQ